MSDWQDRATRRNNALTRNYESVKLIATYGGGKHKRETKVYQTGKSKFRVYLFEYGANIDSKQFTKKSAAIAQAKAWA